MWWRILRTQGRENKQHCREGQKEKKELEDVSDTTQNDIILSTKNSSIVVLKDYEMTGKTLQNFQTNLVIEKTNQKNCCGKELQKSRIQL